MKKSQKKQTLLKFSSVLSYRFNWCLIRRNLNYLYINTLHPLCLEKSCKALSCIEKYFLTTYHYHFTFHWTNISLAATSLVAFQFPPPRAGSQPSFPAPSPGTPLRPEESPASSCPEGGEGRWDQGRGRWTRTWLGRSDPVGGRREPEFYQKDDIVNIRSSSQALYWKCQANL